MGGKGCWDVSLIEEGTHAMSLYQGDGRDGRGRGGA